MWRVRSLRRKTFKFRLREMQTMIGWKPSRVQRRPEIRPACRRAYAAKPAAETAPPFSCR